MLQRVLLKFETSIDQRLLDILVLFAFYIFACVYAFVFQDQYIGRSVFVGAVFMLLPVIYMGVAKKKNWSKLFLGALIFGCVYGFALSFFAEATDTWTVNNTIFNFRFFSVNTLEEVLGHGMMALSTFTFYEHFLDSERNKKLNRRYISALVLGFFGSFFLILTYYTHKNLFRSLRLPYLYVGLIAITPLIITVIRHPRFLPKIAILSIYFFILYFTVEFFAVAFNYWSYPGNNYVGSINIFGLQYPFEELFFWMLLYAPTITIFYELTIDDGK